VPELPSGTVTILFTDLVGSTRLWEAFPDTMRPALARHDELVRGAIEDAGGSVVKTTADGFHAVFPTARGAVDAAVALQLALAAEPFDATGPRRRPLGNSSVDWPGGAALAQRCTSRPRRSTRYVQVDCSGATRV
jgi:class 3 adenylate cyclase